MRAFTSRLVARFRKAALLKSHSLHRARQLRGGAQYLGLKWLTVWHGVWVAH